MWLKGDEVMGEREKGKGRDVVERYWERIGCKERAREKEEGRKLQKERRGLRERENDGRVTEE